MILNGLILGVTLVAGETDVVIAPDAPRSVRFAAEEMTNLLSRTFGAAVPVTTEPKAGRRHVVLGDNAWSRAAGLDASGLPRDAFTVVAKGTDVLIAGRDDPKEDTRTAVRSWHTGVWAQLHEHATLFGVYGFLERHAGVRLYFPGELGTIVPRRERITVPDGTTTVAPEFLARNYSWSADGAWYEGERREAPLLPARKLNYQRNRMQSVYVPCCHGERGFHLLDRFAESHPEYFVRKADGTRRTGADIDFPGHLCHSSDVWNEMYEDILSYARGDGPEVRGVVARGPRKGAASWSIMAFRRPWVDVMPQDGFVPCQCDRCRAAYRTNEVHYASELIWGRTVELAQKLKAAGCDLRICQMAYTPYRRIPALDIPDNVDVMVAEHGPWSVSDPASFRRQVAEVKAWSEKLGRRVWVWTYPNKFGRLNIPDVPNGTPRAWATFFKAVRPYVFGAYAESENDRSLYNMLSYYVFGKVCWDPGTDVEALLEEHFRLMFGRGAEPMAALVREIEDVWIGKVAGKVIETPLGPATQPPSTYSLFTGIYTPELLRRWKGYIDRAAAAVPKGSLEHRRVALCAREILVPLKKASKAYLASVSVEDELARRAADPARTNLFVNGSFDLPRQGSSKRHFGKYEKGRWVGGWITTDEEAPFVSFSNDGPKGSPACVTLKSADGARTKRVTIREHFRFSIGHLTPGRRYRISVFVRLNGVVPTAGGGGAGIRVWDDRNHWFPDSDRMLTGTTGWFHQEFYFTAGANSGKYSNECELFLRNATGSVSFAGARFEEVSETEGGAK